MPRTIYLAVLSNGARPAHFSVFVPTGDKGETGKVIHVTGNPATGFFLQFKRNYDLATSEYSLYNLIPLSRVDDRYIKDTVGSGQPAEDTIARDRLESVATTVPPPGRSANPFDPSSLEQAIGWGKSLELKSSKTAAVNLYVMDIIQQLL
ncbi:hypothetical protein HFD88_009933 [Aspergillus terreus]|nr:hypothetical protein HFD88_009933 [Aspergillus terreus]